MTINQRRQKSLHILIISSLSFLKVRADYPCVCNYNVETAVYGQASADGAPIGYMYEFDCKSVGQVHGSHSGFSVIQFEHKYGYVADDNNVNAQTCPGNIPDSDLVTTTTKAHSHATNGHTSTTASDQSTTIPTSITHVPTASTTPIPSASTTPLPTTSTSLKRKTTTPYPTTTTTTPTPTTTMTPKPTTTTATTTPIPTTPSTEAPSTPYQYWLMAANVTGTPLQYVGIGYNLLTGNPELTPDTGMLLDRRILELTGSQNSVREASYSTSSSCNRSEATFLVHGGKSLQAERLTRVNISASHPSSVQSNALMGNSDFYSRARVLSDGSQVYYDRTITCKQGSVRYQGNALRPEENFTVSRNFAADVCRLPIVFNPNNVTEYMQFLDNWGTSVIMSADLGTKTLERYSQSLSGLAMEILEADPSLFTHSGTFMGYTSSLTVDENRYLSSSIARQHHTSSRTDGTLSSPVVTRIDVISITDVISKAYFGPILDELTAEGVCKDTIYDTLLTTIAGNVRRALEQYPMAKMSTGPNPMPSIVDHSLQIPVTWPRGNYGLMKTAAGCPGAKVSWQSGWRHYDTEDLGSNNGYSSGISHFLAGSFHSDNIRTEFCIKTISTTTSYDGVWPRGSYCLLKYRNCPNGFRDGSIFWDDEDISNSNSQGGTLPAGSYDSNTRIYYCCRSDGQSSAAMILPTDRPFVLMRYGGKCQTVYGMSVRDLYVHWDDDDLFNKDSASGMHPDDTGDGDNHELHFCYYQSSGHGGIIG